MNGRNRFYLSGAILILGLAFAFQLYNANTPYGNDTTATLTEIAKTNKEIIINYFTFQNLIHFNEMSKEILANQLHLTMPGFYVIAKGLNSFSQLFATDLIQFLPMCFSWLSIVSLIICGWMFISPSSGILLGLMGTFSPLYQYYGSYMRFYSALVFFSTLAFFILMGSVHKLTTKKTLSFFSVYILLSPIVIWLPMFIHVSGALSSLICLYLLFFYIFPRVNRFARAYIALSTLLIGFPVVINSMVFVAARFLDSSQELSNVMSQSILSFFSSLFFNFNGLIFVVILYALLFQCISRDKFLKLYLPYLLCFGLLTIGVTYRHNLFRPDYLVSILPMTYFLFVDSLESIVSTFRNKSKSTNIQLRGLKFLIVLLVLFFSFPTFISNLIIDQDRPNYKLAAKDMTVLCIKQKCLIFTLHPEFYKKYASDNMTFYHLNKTGKIPEEHYDSVYYLLEWKRMGFHKDFTNPSYTNHILNRSTLIKISGNSRLDPRDYLIFIFKKILTPLELVSAKYD